MAAINEHGKPDTFGASETHQRVNGGAHGATGGEHVIYQHDRLAGQIAGQLGGSQLAHATLGKIIAMEAGLHRAGGHGEPVQSGEGFTQLLSERDTAALNAHKHERGTFGVGFGNLMRHPAPGAAEVSGFQYNAFVRHGGGHKKSRAAALARESNAELIRFVSSTLAASQDRIKGVQIVTQSPVRRGGVCATATGDSPSSP